MSQYRDDRGAARLRIEALEARLAEREADLTRCGSALAARDEEILRLQRELEPRRGRAASGPATCVRSTPPGPRASSVPPPGSPVLASSGAGCGPRPRRPPPPSPAPVAAAAVEARGGPIHARPGRLPLRRPSGLRRRGRSPSAHQATPALGPRGGARRRSSARSRPGSGAAAPRATRRGSASPSAPTKATAPAARRPSTRWSRRETAEPADQVAGGAWIGSRRGFTRRRGGGEIRFFLREPPPRLSVQIRSCSILSKGRDVGDLQVSSSFVQRRSSSSRTGRTVAGAAPSSRWTSVRPPACDVGRTFQLEQLGDLPEDVGVCPDFVQMDLGRPPEDGPREPPDGLS